METESKERKEFVETLEKRVNGAIKAIRRIGDLAKDDAADCSDGHAIAMALREEAIALETRFEHGKPDPAFQLSDYQSPGEPVHWEPASPEE